MDITNNGIVETFGKESRGIYAQSVGGFAAGAGGGGVVVGWGGSSNSAGDGGAITVTNNGSITTTGKDSDGVYAQSVGGGGGRATASGGLVGINTFRNQAGARFNTGPLVDLGDGNTLINDGTLSPGGSGVVLHTLLDGDLFLSDSGVLEIDIGGFTPGSFDSIEVTGTLAGGSGSMGLLSLAGSRIDFSFLPDFEPGSELGARESMVVEFLTCSSMEDFAISYSFSSRPFGLRYDVYQEDGSLYLRASNMIPSPGALLLASIGLGLLGLRRRRSL